MWICWRPHQIPMSCLANPFVGREEEMKIVPAEEPKHILVASAGPAGLQFAAVAANRGHKVTVFEKNTTVGGQFALAAVPPTKQPISNLIKHYYHRCQKHGAEFKLGCEVNKAIIDEVNPDAVVIATGSVPLVPSIEGIDGANVVTAIDILAGKAIAGNKVAVLGGGSVGVETADFLAETMRQVSVVEMRDDIGIDEAPYPKIFLMQRLQKYGVQSYTGAKVSKINLDGVTFVKDDAEQTITGFDTIVLAFGVRSYNPLKDELEGSSYDVYSIGDAVKGRNAVDAIYEGAKLGVTI